MTAKSEAVFCSSEDDAAHDCVSQGQSSPVDSSADGFAVPDTLTAESIYNFYLDQVIPALLASLPVLLHRVADDAKGMIQMVGHRAIEFILPKWDYTAFEEEWSTVKLQKLLEQKINNSSNPSLADFVLRQFDKNGDGHISPSELIKMTEIMQRWHASPNPRTWFQWLSREWPLMDWKLGVFIWRSCGGLLLVLALFSIVPGRLHGISARILRWPVLALTYFLIGVELGVYVCIRVGIRVAEALVAKSKHRRMRREMARAKSYEQWYRLASELDKSQKKDVWQSDAHTETTQRYNWQFIRELMNDMRLARETNDSLLALAVLQQCTRKNVGGVMSDDLFSYTNTGEPTHMVREFIEEVVMTMRWVTLDAMKVSSSTSVIHEDKEAKESYQHNFDEKVRSEKDKVWKSLMSWATLNFQQTEDAKNADGDFRSKTLPSYHRRHVINLLRRARSAYGRTALCLSGGAMMGCYHFGHVMGLLEAGVLPNIISGTSAGSVIGAIICTRTDEEIRRDMRPSILKDKLTCFTRPWPERMKSFFQNGNLFSFEEWLHKIQWFTMGDMTFEEAYRKTGRVFCITLSATTKKAPPVLLNHLSAPNVTIRSAVVASAAVPFFIPAVKLEYKDDNGVVRDSPNDQTYFDGSIRNDIPTNGLAEMLNCQFFIAAQCNPHVVPFFFSPKGSVGRPSRWSSGRHEHSWRGGFLLAALEMYLKNDMKAKFKFLHEVEAAVGFTSTLMTQEFVGSTTLVPQVRFIDYFKLFENPSESDLRWYFKRGAIAAYEHIAMIKLHYSIADSLDECIEMLESGDLAQKRRTSLLIREPDETDAEDYPTSADNGSSETMSTRSSQSSSTIREDSDFHWSVDR